MSGVDPTLIGAVQDVTGGTIRVVLDPATISGLCFIGGQGYRIGQVGSFVRIPIGFVDLFGIVSQVGAGAVPAGLQPDLPHGNRWMTVQLVGESGARGGFERGISQYPTIDDKVHLVTESDLGQIYGRSDSPMQVRIGHLSSAEAIPALVNINKLVTRHSAVVGTTGAGKSTTVTRLLQAMSDPGRYPSARIIVLDMHGEYARALAARSTVFRVGPTQAGAQQSLSIPYWALTSEELLAITLGPLEDNARAAVLDRIARYKRETLTHTPKSGITPATVTVDSPIPFSIQRLWFELHKHEHATYIVDQGRPRLQWQPAYEPDTLGAAIDGDALSVSAPSYRATKNIAGDPEKIQYGENPLGIRRQVGALEGRLKDPRYGFLFSPGPWLPDLEGRCTRDLDELLVGWLGGDRPITVLDLSGVPPEILSTLIGVLLRIVYEALFWARNLPEGGRERPLLVVLEEAHAYLGKGEQGSAAVAVRRIAKEGRKYGIGAMIVSQRPSEVDSTILSQCGTIVAMRLANASDRSHIASAATDNLEGLFAMLPVLRTGEAIVVGEAVNLPVRAIIDAPSEAARPDSGDPEVVVGLRSGEPVSPGGWNQPLGPSDYAEVVAVWRGQNSKSPRAVPRAGDQE